MLKVLVPTFMLIPTVYCTALKQVWSVVFSYGFLIASFSFVWLKNTSETSWVHLSLYMAADPLSGPLLGLSCWLLPLLVLASKVHMGFESGGRQRIFLVILVFLQCFLILAFGATELLMFFIMFEATLIPTIALISRWGSQMERLNAGTYFLFYTLTSSLPLLVVLLFLQGSIGSLSLLTLSFTNISLTFTHGSMLLWFGCFLAFFVKMPLYGVHLWLPKAHVEASIAGSMVLAAVLLKLGGYGMMRVLMLAMPFSMGLGGPFIAIALWGLVMTGFICLRQTDLKALIAYSSVAHMGLVIASVLTQDVLGYSGALILMIAHGLSSSALFCLANTNYERVGSRTLILVRGAQLVLPLMGAWWFIVVLANLGLPPVLNLLGEFLIIIAVFNWSFYTILLTGLGIVITGGYSLYMFLLSQRGVLPSHVIMLEPTHTREHLLIMLHVFPLLLLVLKPGLVGAGF
uniref:NADH-ubiquinone oxidoreductase chain 4 n=1 Tax=Tetrabrachium ocellatum TaxID=242972 RepID=D3KRE2_TETOC|nr:NADH dehydrogenase subunit 4 [Tetrabrachium ocellatum]